MSKQCTKCGESFPIEQFHRNKGNKDGRDGRCKACAAARYREESPRNRQIRLIRDAEYYRRNSAKILARHAGYRKTEKYRQVIKASVAKWNAKNPEKVRAHNRLHDAVRYGKIFRKPCEECGNKKSQAHHHKGYEIQFALDVVWLCVSCHKKRHRKYA